jgi:hypothetical protein
VSKGEAMTFMIEVIYRAPRDSGREERVAAAVGPLGGMLTFVEGPSSEKARTICLTYEFSDLQAASNAADRLRALAEHVEGPSEYGDD